MPEKKYIRFINSHYKTQFHLPDGGRIRILYADGEQADRVCRFIDEFHTQIGISVYHIDEFAELLARSGAEIKPLDYIREPEFYRKCFPDRSQDSPGPAYYIIDETEDYCLAFAPKGAAKGRKYCVCGKIPDGPSHYRVGEPIRWGSSLKNVEAAWWGFNMEKVKAITQRRKTKDGPER